jgi:hypothetical protein
VENPNSVHITITLDPEDPVPLTRILSDQVQGWIIVKSSLEDSIVKPGMKTSINNLYPVNIQLGWQDPGRAVVWEGDRGVSFFSKYSLQSWTKLGPTPQNTSGYFPL